jgi:putative DNA primase/helicase
MDITDKLNGACRSRHPRWSVYSHHGSDPLSDGHTHDAFDVYRILDHAGDTKAAVKAAAEELGMGPGQRSGNGKDTSEENLEDTNPKSLAPPA